MSSTDPKVLHQCSYKTGAYQCGWGELARQSRDFVLCPVHAESLKRGVTDLSGMFAILMAERALVRGRSDPEDYFNGAMLEEWKRRRWTEELSREEALAAMSVLPFHWQPIESCWRTITGHDLPSGYVMTSPRSDAHHVTTKEW